MKSSTRPKPGPDPEFTQRVVFHEAPEVTRRLQHQAKNSGCSMSAIVRAACRYWLQSSGA